MEAAEAAEAEGAAEADAASATDAATAEAAGAAAVAGVMGAAGAGGRSRRRGADLELDDHTRVVLHSHHLLAALKQLERQVTCSWTNL